jgi:hypothetical protein
VSPPSVSTISREDEEEAPLSCQQILDGVMTLQDAVTCSIKAVPSFDTRCLLSTKILLVGGGIQHEGLVDHFEDMLVGVLPYVFRQLTSPRPSSSPYL